MKKYLLIYLIVLIVVCELECDVQKGFYLSYDAMGNRQQYNSMLEQINTMVSNFSITHKESNTTYKVENLHMQMYYNEHDQKETNVDEEHVNVTLGDIQVAFRANYEIDKSGNTTKGWFRGRGLADQHLYFTKKAAVVDGQFVWDLVDVVNISCSGIIMVDHTSPVLEDSDVSVLQTLVNDHFEGEEIKAPALKNYNSFYNSTLKKHLNSESIISDKNFTYTYGNFTQNYTNSAKEFKLSDKGLDIYFYLEVPGFTKNCTSNLIKFEEEQGGIQELISISTLSEAFRGFLQNGGYDAELDQKWDVQTFQFYMGDLANFVPAALEFQADEPFFVSCAWNKDTSRIMFRSYDLTEVYALAGEVCTIKHNSEEWIKIKFDLGLVVTISAENEQLTFRIKIPQITGISFESLSEKYKVVDQTLATFMIGELAKSLTGVKTVGSSWPTAYRRFPSTKVTRNYLILFDAAQK